MKRKDVASFCEFTCFRAITFHRVSWQFGVDGSDVGQINEVTLRRARLVLGSVTVSGFNSRRGKFISVQQPP